MSPLFYQSVLFHLNRISRNKVNSIIFVTSVIAVPMGFVSKTHSILKQLSILIQYLLVSIIFTEAGAGTFMARFFFILLFKTTYDGL